MRRGIYSLVLLLTLPTFASAYNCWSVSRSTSPTAQAGTLVAPANGPTGVGTSSYNTVGSVTYVTAPTGGACATAATTIDFTLTPPAGAVPTVKVDGAAAAVPAAGPASTVYTVSKGSRISHTINATYQAATTKVTITTTPAAGGYIEPTQTVAYNGGTDITVTANAGYTVTEVKINGTASPAALAQVLADGFYTFANVTTPQTLTATFTQTPTLSAAIATANATIQPGATLNLVGSAVKNMSTIVPTYSWSAVPAGATFGSPTAATSTFTAPAGTYTVTLTVADAALSLSDTESRTIVVQTSAAAVTNACLSCHNGRDPQLASNFQKSSHLSTTHFPGGISCANCHNPSGTAAHPYDLSAAFKTMSGSVVKSDTGCQSCHSPGSPYGIYNADQTGKAPHFQTGTADAGGYYPTSSFITAGGATCIDCHGHNNAINAGWAEGGHGSLTAVPWKSDASHNWNNQGSDGINYTLSPQKTNCIRCHTSRGFAQYWDSGFSNINKVYLTGTTVDKASAPLTCNGCHTSAEGALRALPAGFAKVKSFYGYSNVTYAPAKMVTNLEFTDNKNSNICLPCHSQRATGTGIKALFAQAAYKQYSVGTNMYPHEAQPAAIVDGKGGYEFSGGSFAYQDRMRHIRIGNYGTNPAGYNSTGITTGNCAGCHMTSEKSHSLEVLSKDVDGNFTGIISETCAKCHPASFTYQDVQAKKAEFDAAVTVLGQLLLNKGFTQDGINVIAERKAFDMSKNAAGVFTKDNAVAEKNVGAWFNWYLFKVADKAGYAHNPAYSRRLINDSIDWMDDNTINGSAAATVAALAVSNPSVVTAQVKADANAQLNNPGCMGCHFGTGGVIEGGEVVPGIEQAPHFNKTAAVVPGQTFTQAQFVVAGTQCNNCHGYGHGTDSPGGTIITDYAESQHGSINGLAWTDYDFKTRAACVECHTTTGFVNSFGKTFTAGAPNAILNAWGDAADTTKQVLACNACHSSTAWKTSVRTAAGGVTVPMGVASNSTTPLTLATFADVGESNVCIPCHASRENGASLLAGNPANTTTKGFTNPHYLGAAAVFYGTGGFQFYSSGVRYNTYGAAGKIGKNANWSHGKLGMDNYSGSGNNDLAGKSNNTGNKGQCVACHLGPKNTHTFGAAEVANETMAGSTSLSGGLAMTRTCYGCHKGNATSAVPTIEQFIEEEVEIWNRMFDFFKWQLAQYGINYTEAYPYFNNAFGNTVGTTFGGAGVIDNNKTRGAAMNLKLLIAEKGSPVHNRAFGRALIADSIVYLQKGDVGDRTVVEADVNNVIKFSDYSTARPTSYPGQVGPDISITTLKSYLTRTATGGFIRR